MIKSGITQEELIKWGGAEVFNQALAICNSGDVKNVAYNDDNLLISGKIEQPDGWEMPVSFTLKAQGRIQSHCPCYANQKLGQVCPHVVAVGIALMVQEMENDEINDHTAKESSAKNPHLTESNPNDIPDEEDGIIEVPMRPKFYAYISGNRAALSIALDAWYDQIEFPACSLQSERTVRLKDPNDPYIRRIRSIDEERRAIDYLKNEWGFEPGYRKGDLKLYTIDQQKILNFLGGGLPALRRRGWKLDIAEKLEKILDSMRSILPFVKVKDAPNGDFDINYIFEAQNKTISPIEIQAALNRGDSYILKDNEVYLLDTKAIELMHNVFSDASASQGGAKPGWFRVKGIYAPYIKSSLDTLADVVETDDSEAIQWRKNAIAKNREESSKFEAVDLGKLENVLRPYQKQGVYWMRFLEKSGLSGLLADEMGLGKTLQTLTWLSLTKTSESDNRPSLIICPTSLVRNWEAEAAKFTPWMKTLVISGPNRADDFIRIDSSDIVITSYALLQRDFEEAWLGREFNAVVLDEAQHIKNRQTKNAKAVKMLSSKKRLVLTGTPVENSVADVWSIFDFLMPNYLGEYESFKLNYEEPIAEGGSRADDALARLKRKLHPFILRRVKKMVAKDLPDKIIKISYCPMDEDSQREYNEALMKTRRQAGDIIKAKGFAKSKFELLAMLMKLRQIASLGKVGAFMEQLQSAIDGGHKILVFSQFVKMLQIIASLLQEEGIPFCYLDGSTKDRLGECNRFNNDKTIPVFLISLMAGGTGLNLTGADMVIHYDPWWNPAVEAQATDRAHRIGQKKTVYVMKMIASGSIEERVLALQKKKEAVISATVSTSDSAIIEKLSSEDIASLLSI